MLVSRQLQVLNVEHGSSIPWQRAWTTTVKFTSSIFIFVLHAIKLRIRGISTSVVFYIPGPPETFTTF